MKIDESYVVKDLDRVEAEKKLENMATGDFLLRLDLCRILSYLEEAG